MKIISWNTNGLRATAKNGFLFPLFKKEKTDILCLQETKTEASQLPDNVRNIPNYYSYFSHPKEKKGYSGVAIYVKKNSPALKIKEVFYEMNINKNKGGGVASALNAEGRIVGVKFKDFTLINGYFPNGGAGPHRLKYKLEFYEEFLKFILKLRGKGENVIFCGDINTAHNEIDLARPKANEKNTGFLPIERAWISKVIKNKFIDIWREKNPNKKDVYTYWDQKTRSRDRNVGWRLDYFFIDEKLLKKVKNVGTLQNYMGSDHCPIYLEI